LVSILFATGFLVDQRWGPERKRHRQEVRFQQARLDFIERRIREYHDRSGRYPSSEEGLEVIPGLRGASLGGEFSLLKEALTGYSGVRTLDGVPFVYENRRAARDEATGGREKGAWKASPARGDNKTRRRWSRVIDNGIYLSDIGLRHDTERVFGRAWLDALLVFSGGVIFVLAIAYTIARNRRDGDRVRGINAVIVVGVAILLFGVLGLTNGPVLSAPDAEDQPFLIGGRRPDLLEEYLTIHHEFVKAGVFDADVLKGRETLLRAEFGQFESLPTVTTVPNDRTAPASSTEEAAGRDSESSGEPPSEDPATGAGDSAGEGDEGSG